MERLGYVLQPRQRVGVGEDRLDDLDKALDLGVVDQAAHGALFAGLLGQVDLAVMSFPVFEEHPDQPPQGTCLGDIQRAPGHIGGDEVAVLVVLMVFKRHDKALFTVAVDREPGAAQYHGDRFPASAARHFAYKALFF